MKHVLVAAVVICALLEIGCEENSPEARQAGRKTDDSATDADTDSDSDTDTDTVSDIDSDTDIDGDSDSDSDSDSDTDGDVPKERTNLTDEGQVCDGIDNDSDGDVDDIDKDGDGVCDCLRVGTYGTKGNWGEGNVFGEWLASRSDIPITELPTNEPITKESLEELQVLVIRDLQIHAWYTTLDFEESSKVLYEWVQSGGGLIVLSGYDGSAPEETVTNEIISKFGVRYKTDDGFLPYKWEADHPMCNTQYVNMKKDSHRLLKNVDTVGINTGNAIEATDGETLATDSDGNIIAQVVEAGEGTAFFFCDEWLTYDVTWSDETCNGLDMEQFWINILLFVTPEDECQIPVIIV